MVSNEFVPIQTLTVDEAINEFLYVSKIHRHEKIWLKNWNVDCSDTLVYGEMVRMRHSYGLRKRQLRDYIYQHNARDILSLSIKEENLLSI